MLWEREGAGLGSQGAACRSESAGAASPYCCPPPRIGTRGRVVRVLRDLVFSVLLWVGSVVSCEIVCLWVGSLVGDVPPVCVPFEL